MPSNETVLRTALTCLLLDEASALTAAQRTWLQRRLQAPDAPFTPGEVRKLVPRLLAWSTGRAWEAALREGIREVAGTGLVSQTQEE